VRGGSTVGEFEVDVGPGSNVRLIFGVIVKMCTLKVTRRLNLNKIIALCSIPLFFVEELTISRTKD
jgi:hypothetical protein